MHPDRPSAQATVRRILRLGYKQLYTNFAWTYDAVAAAVSLGRWREWGAVALEFIPPDTVHTRVLEVAHGPGHLQLALRQKGYATYGIDLSPQMSAMAHSRLSQANIPSTLARADVRCLPFADASFDSVISTFPAEFIFAMETIREIWRILRSPGRLVVVPSVAWRMPGLTEHIAEAWTRFTHLSEDGLQGVQGRFEEQGFAFRVHLAHTHHANVIVWQCDKCGEG